MNIASLKKWFLNSSQLLASSAQLAKKQAELAELSNVALPRIYHAIGKTFLESANVPPELSEFRDKVNALESTLSETPAQASRQSTGDIFVDAMGLAGRLTRKAAKTVDNAGSKIKIHAAYINAGRAAVNRLNEHAMPPRLLSDLQSASEKRARLSSEIAEAAAATGGRSANWLSVLVPSALVLYSLSWLAVVLRGGLLAVPPGNIGYLPWHHIFPLSNVIVFAVAFVLWFSPGISIRILRLLVTAMTATAVLTLFMPVTKPMFVGYLWTGAIFLLAIASWYRLSHEPIERPLMRAQLVREFALATGCYALVMLSGATVLEQAEKRARELDARLTAEREEMIRRVDDQNTRTVSRGRADDQSMTQAYQLLLQLGWAPQRSSDAVMQRHEAIINGMQERLQRPQPYSNPSSSFGQQAQGGYRRQMWEGQCTRCGWSTGRQVSQGSRNCIQIQGGGFPCGGVVIWGPMQ